MKMRIQMRIYILGVYVAAFQEPAQHWQPAKASWVASTFYDNILMTTPEIALSNLSMGSRVGISGSASIPAS